MTPGVMRPAAPKTLADTGLGSVMLRDILLKTMFRQNLTEVTALAAVLCLPIPVTQELVDLARSQQLVEATGTLHANSGGEMGYQLTDAGKARALDALSQSEYFGAMPVPLETYGEQMKRQSIRNIHDDPRPADWARMGHLILPDGADRPSRPRRRLGPLDPDVRPARQRQVLDLERHPRRAGRHHLHPARGRIFRAR